MSSEADAKVDAKVDAKAEDKAEVPKATAKAVPRIEPDASSGSGCCSFWCVFVSIVVPCFLFLGLLGLAYLNIVPGTFIRPYFFSRPSLTQETWEEKTSGKTVFVKFYAPWCGHCKRIAPAWEKLTAMHEEHSFVMVGESDCTDGGKALCSDLGVSGFPTLMYGSPNNLQTYKGGRSFEDLSEFVSKMEPTCSLATDQSFAVCTEEQKADIKKFQAMTSEGRKASIKEQEDAIEKVETDFKAFVEKITAEYKEATAKKEADVKAVQDTGLSMLKAINAFEANKKKEEAKKAEL